MQVCAYFRSDTIYKSNGFSCFELVKRGDQHSPVMKVFVLYFAVIVCFAISNSIARSLNYPTPINPSVLIETKPEEKVILISDIKEISKFKRETSKPFYPTITPEQAHHISKRENVFRHSVRYKRDIPVPLVAKHKHPEISASENGDHKSTDENVESFANDQVVKDKYKQDAAKSEGSQPVSHPDHTPETLTTHSVIRPKPVSVSELFSRHHETDDK